MNGESGFSGLNGESGFSGLNGESGYSGLSGYSSASGISGFSGYSGYSGSGISGYSGYSGVGFSGRSGYSGAAVSGFSGFSGAPGTGSGPGLTTRKTFTTSTSIIDPGTFNTAEVSGFKTYVLQKVQTNASAWVVIYSDETSRNIDLTRPIGLDPVPGSGVIAEVITTAGNLTQLITPGVIGFNNDNPVTTSTYLKVTNNSGVSQTITVILTLLQLES